MSSIECSFQWFVAAGTSRAFETAEHGKIERTARQVHAGQRAFRARPVTNTSVLRHQRRIGLVAALST
jgi:hypothetical protein